jgi:tetratricopeptide (TPR) repeat protein
LILLTNDGELADLLTHPRYGVEKVYRARVDPPHVSERAVRALREAGERALTLNALAQAENYYRQARALAPDDAQLLLRYGRVLYLQNEEGEAELTEAHSRLEAAGEREAAAEASLMLADIAWKQGRPDDMQARLDAARALVDDRPASRVQAAVLNELARYEMLADDLEAAIEIGQEALALAEELGLDELRARALNTIAVARADMGDVRGFADAEEAIALALRLNAISEVLRGTNNLAALYILHGDFEHSRAMEAETIELAERYGQYGSVRFIEAGAAIAHRYLAGEWDDALARIEKVIAAIEAGERFYQTAAMYGFRALFRVARGDDAGAAADAERSFELTRSLRDPQALHPDLAVAAFVFISVGNTQRADAAVTHALESFRRLRHFGFAVIESPTLAWGALKLGREKELAKELERESFKSPWLRAALAALGRDFAGAADILGECGFKPFEAFLRLQSGAEEDVRRALEFYRSVRATRYVREAEALLQARVS